MRNRSRTQPLNVTSDGGNHPFRGAAPSPSVMQVDVGLQRGETATALVLPGPALLAPRGLLRRHLVMVLSIYIVRFEYSTCFICIIPVILTVSEANVIIPLLRTVSAAGETRKLRLACGPLSGFVAEVGQSRTFFPPTQSALSRSFPFPPANRSRHSDGSPLSYVWACTVSSPRTPGQAPAAQWAPLIWPAFFFFLNSRCPESVELIAIGCGHLKA